MALNYVDVFGMESTLYMPEATCRPEPDTILQKVPTGGVQPALTQEYLAAILSGMASQGQVQQQDQPALPSLSEVLTPQNLVPLLEDEAVKARLGELVEFLPAEHQAHAQRQASYLLHLLACPSYDRVCRSHLPRDLILLLQTLLLQASGQGNESEHR